MSHLLLTAHANKSLNRTIFSHKLYVYDDKIIFKTRNLFRIIEVTISYNHVSQVFLTRYPIFATLEIINTGGVKDIVVKFLPKKDAVRAKEIIDAKIHKEERKRPKGPYHKHDDGKTVTVKNRFEMFSPRDSEDSEKDGHLEGIESSLNRLTELLHRGKISEKEFEKKRKSILDKLHRK